MKISKDSVVTLDFVMQDEQGVSIYGSSQELAPDLEHIGPKMLYLHGGYNGIFPKVEEQLEGKSVGETISVDLAPADHYGERDDNLVNEISREMLPDDIYVGMPLQAQSQDGSEQPIIVVVAEVREKTAILDANVPLAGYHLRFKAKIDAIRPATEEEITHRHVHGEGGAHS